MKWHISRGWIVFAATSLLFVFSQFNKTSIAVIAPQLMADLSLDAKGISLMSAAFFYTFALAQIPMGVYLDHIGPRITMSVLSLVAAGGGLIFALSDSLAMSIIGRALLGIGMACNLMGSFKLVTLWFSPMQFATLCAVVIAIGGLGHIASSTPLVLMAEGIGWRSVFMLFAAVTAIVSVIFFLVVRDKPHETPYGSEHSIPAQGLKNMLSGIGLLFQTRDYWIISFGSLGRFGIFYSFQGLWAGPYLMEVMGLSAFHTGNLIFILNIGFILGGPFFGMLSDRILKTRKWIVVLGIGGHAILLLIFASLARDIGPIPLVVLFFCFGFFFGASAVIYAHIKDLMPPEMAGTAMAGVNFFALAGAAVFQHGLGSLMQCLYPEASFGPAAFKIVFLICGAYLLVATLPYLFTEDSNG
jgi:sugar phosphate permease